VAQGRPWRQILPGLWKVEAPNAIAAKPQKLPVQDALQTFSREIARDFSLKRNRGKELGAKERAPPF